MELKDKIMNVIRQSDIKNPIFDIDADAKGDIYGTIYSETFDKIDIRDAQAKIWEILSSNLEPEECIKIRLLITEYLPEGTYENEYDFYPVIFMCRTPQKLFYLLIGIDIDMKSISASSQYFIFSDSEDFFNDSCSFNYSPEVLDFMQLNREPDIYSELYNQLKEQGISILTLQVIEQYQKLPASRGIRIPEIKLEPIKSNVLLKYPATVTALSNAQKTITIQGLKDMLNHIVSLNRLRFKNIP